MTHEISTYHPLAEFQGNENWSSRIIHGGPDLSLILQDGTGAVARLLHDKIRAVISPLDFDAVGDGIANDQAFFTMIETAFTTPRAVDLEGRTYLVTTIPTGHRYWNGTFKVGSTLYPAGLIRAVDLVDDLTALEAITDKLQYLADATGAVSRPLQDKLADSLTAKDFGAGGAGVTDDTEALQAFLDYHTGKTAYVSDGTYNISDSLLLPVGTNLTLSEGCTLVATADMTVMIDTDVAQSYDHVTVSGGKLDCNDHADIAIWPKTFSFFRIENMDIRDSNLYGIRLGSVETGAAYEAFLSNIRIIRSLNAAPVNSAGIFIDQCGDSHFSDIVVMGQERGVVGGVSDSKFTRVHCWNAIENEPMLSGFFLQGYDSILVQCQVDGPFSSSGYYLGGGRNHMIGCAVNYTGPDYGGVDLEAVGVFLEIGSEAIVSNCSIKAQSGLARLAADIDGDIAGAKLVNNQAVNCYEIALDNSNTLVRAWVTFNGSGTPAIRASHCVSSITDLGVGKYRVNIANSMRDTNFCLQATGHTDGGATNGLLVYGEGRTTFTADVWAYDPITSGFADPTYVNVLFMGT